MTPVPRDHTPGSPAAVDAGCICTDAVNLGGQGVEINETVDRGQKRHTFTKTYWLTDRTCKVHGGGKFVPFKGGKP